MSSFKNLVKLINIAFSTLIFVVLLSCYDDQNKITSLQYLDRYGITHTLNLSIGDKKKLAELMQKLFAENSFAYCILGSKPISWETFQNPFPLSNLTNLYDSFSEHSRSLRNGWKTWEKYKHLFPAADIWAESSECDSGYISILIINKARFNEVVNENKKDFQQVLCRSTIDGTELIREAKGRSLINHILKGHQALLGIVLGYGRDNSWQFLEGCENHKPIDWVWGNEDSYFSEDRTLKPDINLAHYYLSLYSCPSFAGDPNSAESLALKKEYSLTKQKIISYYKDKDFLEATLSLLAGYRPISQT